MPELARFFGIVIRMYPADHAPPHFHAAYGESEAVVDLRNLSVLRGQLPPRALGLTLEWAALHRAELEACWERSSRYQPPGRIEPLQ